MALSLQLFTAHDVEKALAAIYKILGDAQKDWESRVTAVSYTYTHVNYAHTHTQIIISFTHMHTHTHTHT